MGQQQFWQTEQQLEDLICKLVGFESRTGTQGEIDFPFHLKKELMQLPYFQQNEQYIRLHDAGKERNTLTAFYNSGQTKKTVVLIAHFDTVHTEDFGEFKHLAFQPREVTAAFTKDNSRLPDDAKEDLATGDYLFGRGVMDMKMGLALHMRLLEKASTEQWPINLLLLAVPDEEVNSSGMRAGVSALVPMREELDITYELFLNSEPSFSQVQQDTNYYIYSGTIGKIMPSALFYGIETHAGEPMNGITGHFMSSYLTKKMEFNAAFEEEAYGEITPPPICLQQNDLKQDYSAQTSHHAYALYNVFLFNKNAEQVMDTFKQIATEAMEECQRDYEAICQRIKVKPLGEMKVLPYEELYAYAVNKLGEDKVQALIDPIIENPAYDERQMSVQISDQLMEQCKELAPATVIFFAPPYYPAINSSDSAMVQEKIDLTKQVLKEQFDVEATQVHYFNGISDLSYVNYDAQDEGWKSYQQNTPVWGSTYTIPFEDMQQLTAPVINIGPFGKDAHKVSERLHKKSAFVYTPYAIEQVIRTLFDH